MKYAFIHHIDHLQQFSRQLFYYISRFNPCIFLDSNSHVFRPQKYDRYDILAACGATYQLKGSDKYLLSNLRKSICENPSWLFGYLGYDVKNYIENLSSDNYDGLGFPDIFFFSPEIIFKVRGDRLEIESDTANEDELQRIFLNVTGISFNREMQPAEFTVCHRMPYEIYIERVRAILQHISRGDIYEMNFCQEFYSENITISPASLYLSLQAVAPAPFSAYLAFNNYYLIGASPERFLLKSGNRVISQPMKGTIGRGIDTDGDMQMQQKLQNDPKEKAENIMIVDLMRNDLSKTAVAGSVNVVELCGIYTFNHWHQMISTVSSEVNGNCCPLDIILNAFPMGSMTGVPKIRAMQLIEEYEMTRRGLFSGTLGYFSPEGDFDFNVVIRTILYNDKNKYLSYQTGGAITALSNPENEYNECLLKAKGITDALHGIGY
jgi:para-aminobenzoate synthetase component 1